MRGDRVSAECFDKLKEADTGRLEFDMMYDSVVWDFDGVLVDSCAEAWRAASEILGLLGLDVDIQSQEAFRHYFTRDEFGEGSNDALRAIHRLVMHSRSHLVEPFPCLALVGQQTVPAEIATSSSATFVRKVLGSRAGLFAHIRGRESGKKDALLHMVSRRAIVVTDTVVDIQRCREQSLAVIAVGWGYDPITVLKRAGPDFLVESSNQLEEVMRILGVM